MPLTITNHVVPWAAVSCPKDKSSVCPSGLRTGAATEAAANYLNALSTLPRKARLAGMEPDNIVHPKSLFVPLL